MGARGRERSRTRLWSYSAGKYGFRVRVFERQGRHSLTIAYWDPVDGKTRKASLGHGDRERARDEAEHLAQRLRQASRGDALRGAASSTPGVASPAATPGVPPLDVTLDAVFAEYEARAVPHHRRAGEDRRRLALWLGFFGSQGVVRVADLDDTHIAEFVVQRRHGDLQVAVRGAGGAMVPMKLRAPAPAAAGSERRAAVVKERTIGADLEFLHGVLNWAVRRKVDGAPLLKENPLTQRRHQTPAAQRRRPVATDEDHRALVRVADRVDPQALYGCFLRLLDDLGWRVTGLCHLRASDVSLTAGYGRPYGAVRKNPLVDKEDVDVWVPMSRHARATLSRLLRRRGVAAGESVFLFPAPRAAGRPWSRYHVRDLTERAEALAGVAHVGGAHAWRRKWATERKGHPEVDVMRAGAWRDARSLREAYTHPDAATTFAVVSRRTGVVRRAG